MHCWRMRFDRLRGKKQEVEGSLYMNAVKVVNHLRSDSLINFASISKFPLLDKKLW